MITQTNTSNADFILNYVAAALQTNGSALNTNSVGAAPLLMALEAQAALVQSGRVPGGQAYQKGSNGAYIPPGPTGAVASNTNAGTVALQGFETRPSKLNTTKAGAFVVVTNSTTAVSLQLTNTSVNTNGTVGDTVFTSWNQLTLYNLSGLGIDGVASAAMAVAPTNTNGANIGTASVNAAGGIALAGGGGVHIAQNWNGVAIAANATNYTVTPTAGGIFVGVICGS